MPSQTAAHQGDVQQVVEAFADTRARTLQLVGHLDDETLEQVHSPLMSPLVWDLGHIAAYEDLWAVRNFAGEPLLRPDLAQLYDAFETPRAERGDIPFLRRNEALEYLEAVRARTLAAIARRGIDPLIHELVIRHEQQHGETMLQTMELAHLPAAADALAPPLLPPTAATLGAGGLELVEIPAGRATLGAIAREDGGPFSYDNERPRHWIELPAYRIARTPITNATFLTFVEGGGYERREWWSREAWAWKEEYDIERPGGWERGADGSWHEWRMDRLAPLDPDAPVVHVSWFEADAFARAHAARLPTEAEWEKAATWDHASGTARPQPWGDGDPRGRANVDWRRYGTVPAAAYADGAAASGCLGMIGDTWEWTSSRFDGYPGFVAHPYREYSEVFFGPDYRVLRGGSWATRARVATPTFRNWDYPQRRQIFSGFRIAKDSR
ncbi:ergothioneine biosynthesis protein EgtB [Conexibacter sp. CPCC 206217]|uniref:ergothioneine biosynthesis protein EgtB n=1 Tax=Conexibacter sp. CPCC 206217 TaxID=3064574 RepID=UPI002715CE7D|nr:ergothioneine biosynthesis protein EgtB [Conexibacter sp. CPCC 206217]MDO8213020.1 ergothioneine biosynthesis protein EgtB [Conexibacter sp. CPCC 206217]